MDANGPAVKGLTEAHRRYSFLQTASEGLSQNESDSESLAQEAQYQLALQKRVRRNQEWVNQSYEELDEESIEEDSLEVKHSSGEELDVEETQRQDERRHGKENARNKEEIMDKYSELRYDPNWKDSKKGRSFLELEEGHQEEGKSSDIPSLGWTCISSEVRFISRNCQPQEGPQIISSVGAKEFWNSCDEPADVSGNTCTLEKKGGHPDTVCPYNNHASWHHSGTAAQLKEPKLRSERDFIEQNKHTLGLAAQQNHSYLRLHGKKQRGSHQEKAETGEMNSIQAASHKEIPFSKNSIQHPAGVHVELRSQLSACNNILEFDSGSTDSSTCRETSNLKQDSRSALRCALYPTPPAACPPGEDSQFSAQPPCAGEKKKKSENISGFYPPSPCRCSVSEPRPVARHGKRWKPLEHQSVSYACTVGQKKPLNGEVLSCHPWHVNTEAISNNYAFDYSGPPQLLPHPLINRTPSPTSRLIQAAEWHHREISQLADDHLAGNPSVNMLPPIIQRGESDSQLHLDCCEGTQPVLSRSNSEGYLLQMEKQKEKMEKEKVKGSRTKGYMQMDLKLGGLGPDCEAIKEKSEKMKHQKVYAKQVNENNMKNISTTPKRQAKQENKPALSRQKALEYAKTISKPKLFVSRPSEQEAKEEKNLARTLNGENLPPISSLESLQNRHEKEKQVVAAFKTLHIV